MLVTATTVLDTPVNVGRFVRDNLAMGVDHLVVFLDAPLAPGQDEVRHLLTEHPHVTCVPTDRTWWHGDRPDRLNVRQRINANVAVSLVEGVEEVDWLVHLDGDEVVHLDPVALAAIPADVPSLRLAPLEAVSTMRPDRRPTAFKRLLGEEDLLLLSVLGVVDEATNQSYFHGHVLGKSGVRPRSGLRLALHEPLTAGGRRLPRAQCHEDAGLRVLHYDAVSGEEFVRKWRTMAAAGPVAARPDRAPMVRALRRLVAKGLPDDVAAEYFTRIYEATTQDDVATLEDLGLLERVDPAEGTHVPTALSRPGSTRLSARLEELRAAPKRPFHVNHGEPATGLPPEDHDAGHGPDHDEDDRAGGDGSGPRARRGRLGRRSR